MKGKYYYYGEFGFFNVYAIPAIETFYERNPDEKLEICTYAEYGMILKNHFPSIEVNSIDWVFNESMRQMHYYCDDVIFHEKLKSLGYEENLKNITEDYENMKDLKDNHFNILPPELPTEFSLKRKLEYKADSLNGEKFIGILPRKRKSDSHKSRNMSIDMSNSILSCLNGLNYRIVIHGLPEERQEIFGNYIITTNPLEQIMYINNSIFTICPDSGFGHFVLNCNADLIIVSSSYTSFKDDWGWCEIYNPFKNKIINLNPYKDFKKNIISVLK